MKNENVKNHRVREKRPSRQYTLNDIRDSLSSQSTLIGAPPLKVPAEITLKKWSQAGVFDDAVTLEQAVKLTQKRLSDTNSKGGRVGKGLRVSQDSNQSPSIQPYGELFAQQQVFQQTVLTELRIMSSRLTQLEQVAGGGTSNQHRENGADSAALAKAIDQLDAVRRHIGVRFDSEMQLTKQVNASPAGRTNNDGSFLELQRIQGRLSRIEETLQAISSKLPDASD